MYRVSSFASQLLIREATASDMGHNMMKAFAVIRQSAIVVAEYLFVKITKHMEWFHGNVRAFQSALEKAPEVFQSVRVNLPINIALGMVNRLVNEIHIQSLLGQKRIGIDRALCFDMCANLPLQMVLATERNDSGSNFAPALQHSHYGQLVFDSTFCDYPLAPAPMHEPRSAADESLIHFDLLAGTANLYGVLGVHRKANAVHHVPSGLLRDAESAGNLVGTDTVLAVRQHPNRNHPLIHAKRRILKDGSHLDGELLFAALAVPDAPRRDKRMLPSLTTWARNLAIRPAQHNRVVERLLRVAKEAHCLLQGLGKCEALCHD
jgi:hypothetical protein